MLRNINKFRNQKGSMMVEAIAMLGLISMVTPVIYKKAAERTNEMQDINAASQIRTVVNAIDDYLRDNYSTITSGGTVTSNSASSHQSVNYGDYDFGSSDADTSAKTTAPINIEHFRDYLPLGFKSQGRLFDDFQVVIKQTRDPSGERKALTTVMVASPNSNNPDMSRIRSSRIASMIGTNGGFFDGEKATGVQGVWELEKDDLPNGNDIKEGSIVATSMEAVADGTGGGRNVLYRVEMPGRPELNTMETALSMGGNDINEIVNLIAAGNSNNNTINIKSKNGGDDAILHVDGEGIIDSTFKAAGENFIAETGYVQHKQALYVGSGNTEADAAFAVKGDKGSVKALSGKFNVNLEGNIPYVKLTGNNNKTVFEGKESVISFMDQNFKISPEGNTDVKGYTHIAGDLSAADGEMTVNDTESNFYNNTLYVSKSRNVNIGTSGNNADLRVYGGATIDNLNVEKNFKAGKINGNGLYGLNVNESSGDITINSKVSAYNSSGNKIFDIGATIDNTTIAKNLIAGKYDSSRGGIGLAADETGATVRFGDNDSSFIVKDTSDYNQIESKQGYTKFGSNNKEIANFFTNNSDNPQAQFSSDVSVYDGSQKLNILTISTDDSDGSSLDNGRGSIHMRKGVIELDRNSSETDNQSNPISYVKADRFISNVSDTSADATNGGGYSFEVNPAYTSMMNDIKLASRGGARLSDILPDFINKGIYVLDNTYEGTSDWESVGVDSNDLILSGLHECTSSSCDTSAWMGFVPTPNCPPGYMQVATITPIRFAMAQAGIPVPASDTSEKRDLQYRTDPRGDNTSYGTGNTSTYKKDTSTLVVVSENTQYGFSVDGTYQGTPAYWAQIYNTPYTFQINTWLNTTLKAYYVGDKFKGWHGVMGFIYPAVYYQTYATAVGKISGEPSSSDVIWNLFPVRREELSAIATIYCYFDRTNDMFSETYVDKYLPHEQTLGNIRHHERPSGPKYNDPNLDYESYVW